MGQPRPPGGIVAVLLRAPILLYRIGLGRLLGHRFLLLVHTGRRTGRVHNTVLEVVRYERATREAVVAAGWGRRTQWLYNVEAGLASTVVIDGERFVPKWRRLDIDEAMGVLDAYERHSGVPRRVMRAVLSRLLGWTYDGTESARRRAVEQLPLIGLAPRG
jgi:deazaflavin-dependent oxidoreductase (nitroreductase family)